MRLWERLYRKRPDVFILPHIAKDTGIWVQRDIGGGTVPRPQGGLLAGHVRIESGLHPE